ncbi:hypothetical protein SASPL_154226 [Salvia splendens]|uniref:Uncharacterized protein n=1 Tax=Salvia splendens TaxID=180675 RepID=A0A8X8YYI3_SALSN|nr:hypothetical protein SASPL_154226 [Salvia splendens]
MVGFPTKSIVAPEDVWVKILEKNPFAEAFYHKEDPAYSKLTCLFGLKDVKVEGAKEVIIISKNTEALPTKEINKTVLSDQEEELGIFLIDLAPDGQLRTRVEKGRDLPKPQDVGPSARSPYASSCGSNSLIGWSPHLRK